MVVILASLLCALVCIAGLALVARCACRRRRATSAAANTSSGNSSSSLTAPTPPPPKGLKKAAIEALPTVPFGGQPQQERGSECAICLAEFAEGEELRVLPHCSHGFHVACIDTWLGGHASCPPPCRATIVIAYSSSSPPAAAPPESSSSSSSRRCRRCGATCELADDVAAVAIDVPAGDEN